MSCLEFDGDCHARKENWLAMTLEFDKYQFTAPRNDTERRRAKTITPIYRTTWPPALRANSQFVRLLSKTDMHINLFAFFFRESILGLIPGKALGKGSALPQLAGFQGV